MGKGMKKVDLLYEGKAKKVYTTEDPDILIVDYKDDATAMDGLKKGTIVGKGAINNRMTNHIFKLLEKEGIPTHYVEELSDRETLVKKVSIIPLEVIVRNITTGSLCKRLCVQEGMELPRPLFEMCYKDDALGDPFIIEDHALLFGWATKEELDKIKDISLRVNAILKDYFAKLGVVLVDFKLEFGKDMQGNLILADEISPDTCRFWDKSTGDHLDKDRFRKDLGNVLGAYEEIWRRISA